MGPPMAKRRDCPGLVCGNPSQGIKRTGGSHPGGGLPQTRPNAWRTVSADWHFIFGYAPEFAAVRQIVLPWDGSLRSALFPGKDYLTNCLQWWFFEIFFRVIGQYLSGGIRVVISKLTFRQQGIGAVTCLF